MTLPATDTLPPPPLPAADLSTQLVETILAKSHPLIAEALQYVCVPHGFNLELLKALRASDDGKDEKVLDRLLKFSFVNEVENVGGGGPRYAVATAERHLILRRFISQNPQGFIETHRRTLAYRELHPNPDPVIQTQSHLHHTLVINGPAGIEYLARMFSKYSDERRLAATERLIATAAEIQPYLVLLEAAWATELDYWIRYLRARAVQLRGGAANTLTELKALRDDPKLPYAPALVGRIIRAYGRALADKGLYVEAIAEHQKALTTFKRLPENEAEQGYTMLNIGDAYVDLSVSARGQRDYAPLKLKTWRDWLGAGLALLGSIPLTIYLQFAFGLHWNPRSWAMLAGQDWIIARLFGTGAAWYRRADALLSPLGKLADPLQADEKLAHLYVVMGDPTAALPILEHLLAQTEIPLGEYRRARVRASLGHALLRLDRPAAGLEHLQAALPLIVGYADTPLEAQVRALIAEAQLQLGQYAEAMPQFDQSLRLYQKQEDVIGATEVGERLTALENDRRLQTDARQAASTTTKLLERRHYLLRFQHPALLYFRRVMLVLLVALIFLIPLAITRIEIGSTTLAGITFYASPLLENNPDYSPDLAQALVPELGAVFEVRPVLWIAISLLILGSLTYAVLGVLIIAYTPLRTVQAAQAEATRFDMQALAVGLGETLHLIYWPSITQIYKADVRFFGQVVADNSATALVAAGERLVVRGHTAWYASLVARLQATAKFLAPQLRVVDLSYDLALSPAGLSFGFFLLCIFLFNVIGYFNPALLAIPLTNTVYCTADLYPYFQVGLFLAPLWWFITSPLWVHTQLYPRNRWVWWVAGVALVGTLLPTGAFVRPWVVIADMFPALTWSAALSAILVAVWLARDPQPVYALWVRLALAVACLAAITYNSFVILRAAEVYHQLVIGNHWRNEGLAQQDAGNDAEANHWFTLALSAYDPVLRFSPDHVRTLTSRAAVHTQLGNFENAIADYTRALHRSDNPDQIYSSRAIAYTAWADQFSEANDEVAAIIKVHIAIEDLDRALAENPQPRYYLLRGLLHHNLDELDAAYADYGHALELDPVNAQAFLGQGWVLFEQADRLSRQAPYTTGDEQTQLLAQSQATFRDALQSFETAKASNLSDPEIRLALGYAHYRLKEYNATLNEWDSAVQLDPQEPAFIISRGTAHWRLASPTGGDRCSSARFTESEKQAATFELQLAVDDFDLALALEPDNPATYRTRAQVLYLLRFCPGYDFQTQLTAAIADYASATQYAPAEFIYWQFKARLGYVLGRDQLLKGDEPTAQATLGQAIADIKLAFSLDPDDADNRLWHNFIVHDGLGTYYLARGERQAAAPAWAAAAADFERAAELLPKDPVPAFKAGLGAVNLKSAPDAERWYAAGIERAAALAPEQNTAALQAAFNDLNQLLTNQPALAEFGQAALEALQAKLTGN